MHFIGHSTKLLPSANLTLGKEKLPWRWLCRVSRSSTRQRSPLCRAPLTQTLGKGGHCAKCHRQDTRQICDVCRVQWPLHSAKHVSRHVPRSSLYRVSWPLHSTKWLKTVFLFVFYISSKQTEDIYNKHHKHHIYIINNTYISPTPHIYHKRHIYITNVTCLTIYHK